MDFLDIPLQLVKGNYKKILEFYDVDPEIEAKIKLAQNITTSPYLEGEEFSKQKIKVQIIQLNRSDFLIFIKI